MSGTKKSREHLKSRFLKYMFPTEEDFANVFESYVHKDDTIDPDQVKVDGKTITEIIDGKSDDGHKHEIADVNGLESALNAISQILGKQESETIVQLAQRFASLTGKYTNVYTFVTKVKEFLEDADAADETINRWREIESFLQGITDTENLLSLLQQYRQEILSSVEGQYLMQVPDLDAYTDAPTGKIVQYIGETNDKYKHGFIYERYAATTSSSIDTLLIFDAQYRSYPIDTAFALSGTQGVRYAKNPDTLIIYTSGDIPKVGDTNIAAKEVPYCSREILSVVEDESVYRCTVSVTVRSSGRVLPEEVLEFSKETTPLIVWTNNEGHGYSVLTNVSEWNSKKDNILDFYNLEIGTATTHTATLYSAPLPPSWQPLKVQNVID